MQLEDLSGEITHDLILGTNEKYIIKHTSVHIVSDLTMQATAIACMLHKIGYRAELALSRRPRRQFLIALPSIVYYRVYQKKSTLSPEE